MLKVDILCRLPTPPPSTCSSSCASWPSSPPSSSLPSSTSSTCSSGQSVKTIFQLSFAGNTTQQYLLSPTNIQYSLVRNCTNQQWFSKSNLQKTEASRSSEGSGNARLCDIFSWGCICLLFSWYIFYHWKNFRVCALSWSQLQTLNDMTRSMTAPLVHIKKLAKASNVKVGFRLHLDFHLHSPGKLCFAVIGGGGRPQWGAKKSNTTQVFDFRIALVGFYIFFSIDRFCFKMRFNTKAF